MSSFLSFSESTRNRLPEWTGQMRSGVSGLAVGFLLLWSAAVFIPSDTYQTARWYDMLRINRAIAGDVTWFAGINPILVSREGAWFSVLISALNIALAWQTAFGGFWYANDPTSTLLTVIKSALKGDERKVNWVKVAYFLALIALTIFETATGMEYKQTEHTWAGAMKAAGSAFLVENIGSDWAVTAGLGMVLSGIFQMWDAYALGREDIGRIRNLLKKNQPKAQPAQPQPPSAGQPKGKPLGEPVRQPHQQQGNGNGGGRPQNGGGRPQGREWGGPASPEGGGNQPHRMSPPVLRRGPGLGEDMFAIVGGDDE